jgi:hypothetical protein
MYYAAAAYSEKCFEFSRFDYVGSKLLLLIYEIHSVSERYICGYWYSVQIHVDSQCLREKRYRHSMRQTSLLSVI